MSLKTRLTETYKSVVAAAEVIAPNSMTKYHLARKKLELLNSGYSQHGASTQKNSMRGWVTSANSPDEDIVENQALLAERGRDLFAGAPIATGAIKRIRTNVVGSGLKLNANIDYEYLGLTSEQADTWEKNVEREFALWSESKLCDLQRRCTFGQIQSLAIMSALINGDVFVTLPLRQNVGMPYELRINLIESDRVYTPANKIYGDANIKGGIEIDEDGAAVACWISNKYPNSMDLTGKTIHERVEFYGKNTGRPNVLHIVQDWERPSQRRGVSILAPVIESLKQLSRYSEAELMASVVSSMFTVFVKSNQPDTPLGQGIPLGDQVAADDPTVYELGNGAVVGLDEGEDVTIANPARQNTAFDVFTTSIIRQIGMALEIPYEVLLSHFSSSYSASRGALLEAWKMFRMRRNWLVQTFCQPIYEEWLSEAVAKGRIDAQGFFTNESVRKAWCGADWYGPTQGQLDPVKEANAARIRVDEGFSTREREAAELSGSNFEDTHRVRVREEEARRTGKVVKNGMGFSSGEVNNG